MIAICLTESHPRFNPEENGVKRNVALHIRGSFSVILRTLGEGFRGILAQSPRTLHEVSADSSGCLRYAARKSADYLCGSSAEKRKLLVTSTVYEQYPAQQIYVSLFFHPSLW